MLGFFKRPAGVEPRHSEPGTHEIESARTIVRKVEFFGAEDLNTLRISFRWREDFELIPRNIVEDTPSPFGFGGLEEVAVKPRDTFSCD